MDKAEAGITGRLQQKKGLEHEAAYLRQLKDEGKFVVEIPKDRNLQDRTRLTLEAIQSGADVINQAVFFAPPWRDDADFLIKCDTPSDSGDFSYEVPDTKPVRTAEPKHIMQLCVYSDLLTDLQGLRPADMNMFPGDREKHGFRVADFFYYYTRAKGSFESYLQNLPTDPYPKPCRHCNFCPWREGCKAQWEQDDHLSLAANIQRSRMDKLRKAGIITVAEPAATTPDTKIPDLSRDVFLRLRSQAVLQHHKATTGEDKCEVIPFPPGKGFTLMPVPDDGDLFFDMEGDPLYPNGLEYLFGVYYFNGEEKLFKPFRAHDHEEEKKTFKRFMRFPADHLAEHPHAHIYHYNHYETTALKRLACRYAVCEERSDNLLRNQKFIDLYLAVRESIRTSEFGYSIKNMEIFYMDKRANAVATAADSIIVYNEWRETGSDELLQEISDYNEVDRVSTHLLRNWLLTLKPEKRSLIYGYRFPSQEYKLKVGAQAVDIAVIETAGTIVEIVEDACIVKIKHGAGKEPLPESLSIGPPGPIDGKIIRSAIYRYADRVPEAPEGTNAATELLARNVPRIKGKQAGEAVITSDNLQSDALEAIATLENSYLFIQGPQGAGKTYTGSHIIVDLIKRGKKIGVTSNSHKAIHNLLEKVENVAVEKGVDFHGIKKAGGENDETIFVGQFIRSETKTDKMSLDADLFAGTAWTFAGPHFAGRMRMPQEVPVMRDSYERFFSEGCIGKE